MDEITFNGLSLAVRPGRVMTPRQATEQLVAAALKRVGSSSARIADVGTGSGNIAVAIAVAAPDACVFATDTSRCAVALARANVLRHGLAHRVTVYHGDLLDPVPGAVDLVVANLPYLPAADHAGIPIWPASRVAPSSPPATASSPTAACSPPAPSGSRTTRRSSSSSIAACSPRRARSCRRSVPRSSLSPRRGSSYPSRRQREPGARALLPVDGADPRRRDAHSVHVHHEGLYDLFGGYDACFAER